MGTTAPDIMIKLINGHESVHHGLVDKGQVHPAAKTSLRSGGQGVSMDYELAPVTLETDRASASAWW